MLISKIRSFIYLYIFINKYRSLVLDTKFQIFKISITKISSLSYMDKVEENPK